MRILKSIFIRPPTDEAIWSRSPQGFPKCMFSASCDICAIVMASIFPSLHIPDKTFVISTSYAAEDESPF